MNRWKQIISQYLSSRTIKESSKRTYRPHIEEYVAYARTMGQDPTMRDEALLEDFLDTREALTGPIRPIGRNTRRNFRSAVRGWWAWWE